jgi:hypothetical protein
MAAWKATWAIADRESSDRLRLPDPAVKVERSRIDPSSAAFRVTEVQSAASVAVIAASEATVVRAGHGRTADPVRTEPVVPGVATSRVGREAIVRQRPAQHAAAHAWT